MFSRLFDDIGKKIKLIAKIIFWLSIACLVCFLFMVLIAENEPAEKLIALVTALFVCLFMCFGAFLVYGFGEIVENLEMTLFKLGGLNTTINNVAEQTNKKLCEIDEKITKINESAESEEKRS